MKSPKNDPCLKGLNIPEKHFMDWKNSLSTQSFVFWGLKNRVIPKNEYFNWAIEYYDTPYLKDMFFQQHLMTKMEWKKVRELTKWSPEMLPVALWSDLVFIACVNPGAINTNTFSFKHRIVLASVMSLHFTWQFTRELSKSLDKQTKEMVSHNMQKQEEISSVGIKTVSQVGDSVDKTFGGTKNLSSTSFFSKPDAAASNKKIKQTFSGDEQSQESASQEDNNLINLRDYQEKKKIFGHTLINNKDIYSSKEEKKPTFKKSIHNDNTDFLLKSKQNTANIFHKTSSFVKTGLKQITKNIQNNQQETAEDIEEFSKTANTVIVKSISSVYERLWKQTKSIFCTSMVLKVKDSNLYVDSWTGVVRIDDTSQILANLDEQSLFRVNKRGHPYHGFVVKTSANTRFLNKIGWTNYPRHITTIPIKDEQQRLQQIFVGLSTNLLSKEKIRDVEKIVSDFFDFSNTQNFKAA